VAALLAGPQSAGAATEGYSWQHTAKHWPLVYVENHTDGHWSITASVAAWGSGLRAGTCRAGAGCIRVTSPARGHAAPLGQSFIYAAGNRITSVNIQMNASDEAQPSTVRKVAAEHELGHALGLAHDTSYHGVMGPTAFGYDYINSYARKELAAIYGV
jgi:predicted Zn-dependent protease